MIVATSRNVYDGFHRSFSSSDYLQELSDNNARDVYDGLDENERYLFILHVCSMMMKLRC